MEFVSGRLVSGGGVCECCGMRLEEGERVYAPAVEVEDIREYLYCRECKPDEKDLPAGVLGLQPAIVVEEPGADERVLGFEVRAGSICSTCGHYFEEEEWLFVGVVEGLTSGFIYCHDCYLVETEGEQA
jgi:hypothetical protein